MPAYADRRRTIRPRERAYALAAVVLVQAALGIALLTGLRVTVARSADVVQRLIEIALPPTPPPPPTPITPRKTEHRTNLARRRPLRHQLEGVSVRRCDPPDRTALDSKAGLGNRLRRRELPHVKHQRECLAKRTPHAQKAEATLD